MKTFIANTGCLLACVAVFASVHGTAVADSATSAIRTPPVPSAMAKRTTSAPTIDGSLTDAVWASATKHSGFLQREPISNGAPSEHTEFAVLYDDSNIYVGVWLHDKNPSKVIGNLTRRDQGSVSDLVRVAFDSYYDHRTAFGFGINPSGVQSDFVIYDDSNIDDSWDAVWEAGSQKIASGPDAGWSAEFRIPLSQLRFSDAAKQIWGIQIIREIAASGEVNAWSPWPRTEERVVSQFGTLNGISNIVAGRRLELLPYLTGGVARTVVEPNDPLNDGTSLRRNVGLDAKYGLSSAFTLSATVNPDFGQVEADPSQVNLSANELFFQERRPFFLEGGDLFNLSIGDENGESLFYSRRIGGAPHGSIEGEFVDAPTSTAIYGAAKVSGKTGSGWSLGILDAVTAQENATAVNGEGTKSSQAIEPLTNFLAARVKKDFREGASSIGAFLTGVQRDLSEPALKKILHSQAYSGSIDGLHRFGTGNHYSASMTLYGTHVLGSKDAIARTQRLNRHLFQRPDASNVTYDPQRTSLTGSAIAWALRKQSGSDPWRFGTGGDIRSTAFEANDLGFQQESDRLFSYAYLNYRDNEPGGGLQSFRINGSLYQISNLEPRLLTWGGNLNGGLKTADYWDMYVGTNYNVNRWSPRELRGGPALRADNSVSIFSGINSDSRKPIQISANANAGGTAASDSWYAGANIDVRWQARSNLDLSVGPNFSIAEDDQQYVGELADMMDNSHYIFARIRQVTTALTMRVAWTLTPRLGFQLYAQPFVSTGAYGQYKDIDQPGAKKYGDRAYEYGLGDIEVTNDGVNVFRDRSGKNSYGFSRPDFSFSELRSTAVVRWEYRPGSTVFAIWSHGQSQSDENGRFSIGRNVKALSKADSEDVVMVKANYWFGL
jgi:hypothetical protein